MSEPPPISQPPPLPSREKPIQRAVFKEVIGIRLGGISFDYSLIERSNAKAERWINENPDIKVIQIETFHSSNHGITVVWYE